MTASGYHDTFISGVSHRRVGAWELELGQLPDYRWAVDHYSDAAPRKQRVYFDTLTEASQYFNTWPRTRAL